MKKVIVFLADGFEEVEGLTVVDLLRRAGAEVQMVSIMGKLSITGARGIRVEADELFEKAVYENADLLVLPGGMPGTLHLKEHQGLAQLLHECDGKENRIAAICAAPTVLGSLGILKDREACCYPGMENQLECKEAKYTAFVTDGHITTSRGVGTAIPFALELIRLLFSGEKAKEIADSIVYKE